MIRDTLRRHLHTHTTHVTLVTAHVAGEIQRDDGGEGRRRRSLWYGSADTRFSEFLALPSWSKDKRKARDMWKRAGRQRRIGRRARTREKFSTNFPPRRGHHQQPSFGAARESQLGGNLLDSPTDMPQEIPRVFSQRSSVCPRSLVFILSRTIFLPHPSYLTLSLSPSFLPQPPTLPPAGSFLVPLAIRNPLLHRAPTQQPLRARPSLGFVDPPRGRRYRRIVKVSSASAGYIGRNHDGRPSRLSIPRSADSPARSSSVLRRSIDARETRCISQATGPPATGRLRRY